MNTIAERTSRAGILPLVGSELTFDFTNTTSGRGGPRHIENLRTPEHVLIWARHAKIVMAIDGDLIAQQLAADPVLGEALLHRALMLRDIIYAIGTALARGERPTGAHIDALAHAYVECVARAHLTPFDANFAWAWRPQNGVVEAILGPITLSALTTLQQADVSRIKQCAGGEFCGWLFFDTTKNKRRRWCEMAVCGNRAKQKAHRARAQRQR